MRLINTETLTLKQFYDTDLPQYAILSHCWGEEEVSFSDLSNNQATAGAGLSKIRRSCKLAMDDSYGWIWIDTCCIDKSSSAELSEAINSMFRWYQNAKICYAYISDARADDSQSFEDSRWFTRGWTLQELIAPQEVKFFDKGWKSLGSRDELADIIEAATGIIFNEYSSYSATQDLRRFCIAEKMSWAAKRETSRPEDMAYCLLGLFDINMPLLYGEGVEKAFRRLQLAMLNTTDDESIFAWGPAEDATYGRDANGKMIKAREPVDDHLTGLLAPSPQNFAAVIHTEFTRTSNRPPWMMTNRGLQLTLSPGSWKTVKGNSTSSEYICVLFSAGVLQEGTRGYQRASVILVRDRKFDPWSRLEKNPGRPRSPRSSSRILRAQMMSQKYFSFWPTWLNKFGSSRTIYVKV